MAVLFLMLCCTKW